MAVGGTARTAWPSSSTARTGSGSPACCPSGVTDDLDGLIAVLRQQPGESGAIGLVNVADEFFVAVRVRGDDVRLLLSDVTAAVAWDLARQVVDRLGVALPGR